MNKESIDVCFKGQGLDLPIFFYEQTDSTNLRAWQETEKQSDGFEGDCLYVADAQNAGRGRRGRSWESPAGKNLYFSLVLKPALPTECLSMVTLVMALSIAQAIEQLTGKCAGIKWPNDIVLEKRKVCGILTQLKLSGTKTDFLVIGVGINVKSQQFSEELADIAGALEELCGKAVEREQLLAQMLKQFYENYRLFAEAGDFSPLKQAYEELLIGKDGPVRVLDPQGEYEGISRGITATGELLVERGCGEIEQVFAGEVSVRGLYGYV